MATWPARNQQGPEFWDDQLRDYIDEGDAASTGAVSSVNALTGDVVLDADSVGAAPAVHNHDDRYYTETESDARYIQAGDITAIDVLTQAEYDAIDPKIETTLYIIRPA